MGVTSPSASLALQSITDSRAANHLTIISRSLFSLLRFVTQKVVCSPESDQQPVNADGIIRNAYAGCFRRFMEIKRSGLMCRHALILLQDRRLICSDCSAFCFRPEPDGEMTLVLSMNPLLDSEGDPPHIWASERCRKMCLSDPACSSEQPFPQGADRLPDFYSFQDK